MEERLGQKLVDAQIGGAGGGGAALTPVAREYTQRWHAFSEGLSAVVEEHFRQAFAAEPSPAVE